MISWILLQQSTLAAYIWFMILKSFKLQFEYGCIVVVYEVEKWQYM